MGSKYLKPLKPYIIEDIEFDVLEQEVDYNELGFNLSYEDFEKKFIEFPTLSNEIGKLYELINTQLRDKLVDISNANQDNKQLTKQIKGILHNDLNELLIVITDELLLKDERYSKVEEYIEHNELSFMEMCFISVMWMRKKISMNILYLSPALNEPNSVIEKINLEGVYTYDSQGYVSNDDMLQRPYLDVIIPYELGFLLSIELGQKYFIIQSNKNTDLEKDIPLTVEYNMKKQKYTLETMIYNTSGSSYLESYENGYKCPQLFQNCIVLNIVHPMFNDPKSDELFDDVYNAIIKVKKSGVIEYFK